MNSKQINRCIDLLSMLNAKIGGDKEMKAILLELGYIIKQESNDNKNRGLNTEEEQLHKENQQLIFDNMKLNEMVNSKIPNVEYMLNTIISRYRELDALMQRVIETQNTL